MLTFTKVLEDRPQWTQEDAICFVSFASHFQCDDSDSVDEAEERIAASIIIIEAVVENADTEFEQQAIRAREFGRLGFSEVN